MTENITTMTEIYNAEGLLQALKNKESFISINGDYKNEVREIILSKLSDKELLGFELGSAGTVGLLEEVFYQTASFFSDDPKERKEIISRLCRYNMRMNDANDMILYLRNLDY